MKTIVFALLLSITITFAHAGHRSGFSSRSHGTGSSARVTHVRGYSKKDGTYVQPHFRSSSNNTQHDNWSTKGNVNPYTGKEGTKEASK